MLMEQEMELPVLAFDNPMVRNFTNDHSNARRTRLSATMHKKSLDSRNKGYEKLFKYKT